MIFKALNNAIGFFQIEVALADARDGHFCIARKSRTSNLNERFRKSLYRLGSICVKHVLICIGKRISCKKCPSLFWYLLQDLLSKMRVLISLIRKMHGPKNATVQNGVNSRGFEHPIKFTFGTRLAPRAISEK